MSSGKQFNHQGQNYSAVITQSSWLIGREEIHVIVYRVNQATFQGNTIAYIASRDEFFEGQGTVDTYGPIADDNVITLAELWNYLETYHKQDIIYNGEYQQGDPLGEWSDLQ